MKHLTYDERLQIQKALTLKTSFAAIAQTLGKNRTTIAREVKTYARFTGKPARSKCKFTCIFEDRTKCPAPGYTNVCVPSHVPNVRQPAINLSQLSVKSFLVHLMYATDAQTAALAIS